MRNLSCFLADSKDEYSSIENDTQSDKKDIGKHDGVTIGDVDVYHSVTSQKDGKGYTEKNEFRPFLKNRNIDQVTDYNKNGRTGMGDVRTSNRNYYKKK